MTKLSRIQTSNGAEMWTYNIACIFSSQDMQIKMINSIELLIVCCTNSFNLQIYSFFKINPITGSIISVKTYKDASTFGISKYLKGINIIDEKHFNSVLCDG